MITNAERVTLGRKMFLDTIDDVGTHWDNDLDQRTKTIWSIARILASHGNLQAAVWVAQMIDAPEDAMLAIFEASCERARWSEAETECISDALRELADQVERAYSTHPLVLLAAYHIRQKDTDAADALLAELERPLEPIEEQELIYAHALVGNFSHAMMLLERMKGREDADAHLQEGIANFLSGVCMFGDIELASRFVGDDLELQLVIAQYRARNGEDVSEVLDRARDKITSPEQALYKQYALVMAEYGEYALALGYIARIRDNHGTARILEQRVINMVADQHLNEAHSLLPELTTLGKLYLHCRTAGERVGRGADHTRVLGRILKASHLFAEQDELYESTVAPMVACARIRIALALQGLQQRVLDVQEEEEVGAR